MVESPRSGQLTYPGNLRVVGGSLLDIHRASREREREMVGNMLYTRINTFSKSKEERNSARSHRRARNKCRMWQHEERTRLESLLDLTAVERRNTKKRKKKGKSQKSNGALGASPDYIAGHYRPHLTPESHAR